MRVGAVKHREMRVVIIARDLGNASGDIFGFGASIACFVESEIRALAARGGELFADAARVFRDHGGGGVQDRLERTVVLLDAQRLSRRKTAR